MYTMSRIIPAYAGSTALRRVEPSRSKDHPRVCGEHPNGVRDAACLRGSSPRMRGAQKPAIMPHMPYRIIPAYAGSTLAIHARRGGRQDHPRVCGEHLGNICIVMMWWGSSPRMRGAPGISQWRFCPSWIIPAYAGSTRTYRTHRYRGRDHPRVCGEHNTNQTRTRDRSGSSPRMRGARCRML